MRPPKAKLNLTYPCLWTYKLIGPDEDAMRQATAGVICDRSYRITPSRSSETAKYVSLNLELTVESEGHRQALYETLKSLPCITLVL